MTQKNDDHPLPFEEPLNELKRRIGELMQGADESPELAEQAKIMQTQADQVEKQFYNSLSAWNTVEIARHPKRPQTRDYLEASFDAFEELHGDRAFRDDLAIVTGLAQIGDHRVVVVGQHRGRDVNERHQCHAGCPHPEGYRKALLKMKLAERLGLPIVCMIDTKGAYPGLGSEERGQGIALAENIREMTQLRVPILCIVIGEGGSGGALAIGVGNKVLMLRYAYYSVISPEGCASILWRDGEKKREAASVLKLTSKDLLERGFVDGIIEEPIGGAHRDVQTAAQNFREGVIAALDELTALSTEELLEQRYQKYRAYGEWLEGQTLEMLMPQPLPEEEDEEETTDEEEKSEVDVSDEDTGEDDEAPEDVDEDEGVDEDAEEDEEAKTESGSVS